MEDMSMTDEETGARQPTYLVTERSAIDWPANFPGYDPHKFEIVTVETPREEQEQGLRRFAIVVRVPDELTSDERAKTVEEYVAELEWLLQTDPRVEHFARM
jgi:hypothetical protein